MAFEKSLISSIPVNTSARASPVSLKEKHKGAYYILIVITKNLETKIEL